MAHKWRRDGDGYVVTNVWNDGPKVSKRLALHRLITNAPPHVLVDHVRGQLLDCRRRSLRFATHSENSANTRLARKGRSSRYRGVTLHKGGRWQAALKHRDRCIYLGLHDTQEAAAAAYNARAREVWGRFARLNILPPAGIAA